MVQKRGVGAVDIYLKTARGCSVYSQLMHCEGAVVGFLLSCRWGCLTGQVLVISLLYFDNGGVDGVSFVESLPRQWSWEKPAWCWLRFKEPL